MLFNSFEFVVFFPLVFLIYWFLKKALLQNSFLVIASYVFYGWWDWRFLILIALSSGLDFFLAKKISQSASNRSQKYFLTISIIANIGLLGVFKYYNFFIDSFSQALSQLGMTPHLSTLNIILPVGISFYTFQTLSYTIDVYKKRLPAVSNPITFFTFVSFFPQLVAGPIERATNLIPQFSRQRIFCSKLASDGMRQILWGLLKKIVIADNCALLVNDIFAAPENTHGGILILGAILFAFQIYGDFSGYSDIAIGISKLLGIRLMTNFRYPYFSPNIAEFWKRWHISLSTWFKDYVYIPLGGNRSGTLITVRNMVIVFLVSGLWHGASWTYIVWGAIHACLYIPVIILSNKSPDLKKSKFRVISSTLFTFCIVCIAWVFFRAESVSAAIEYFQFMISGFDQPSSDFFYFVRKTGRESLIMIIVMLIIEWIQREKEHGLEIKDLRNPFIRCGIYYLLIYVIWKYAAVQQDFIYFQF